MMVMPMELRTSWALVDYNIDPAIPHASAGHCSDRHGPHDKPNLVRIKHDLHPQATAQSGKQLVSEARRVDEVMDQEGK